LENHTIAMLASAIRMHSRGEANAGGKAKNFAKKLKAKNFAKKLKLKAKTFAKKLKFAKKFPMNAGRKAKMLKMAKTLKLATEKTFSRLVQ